MMALVFVVLLLSGLLLQQMGQPQAEPPTVVVQMPELVAAAAQKPSSVSVRFMDSSEANPHGEATMAATARRPVIVWQGKKYMCARQDKAGVWIYRQVDF